MKAPKFFATELARIFGRLPDGRPNLRCIWGDDPRFFVLRMDGERVPRYPTYRKQRVKGYYAFQDGKMLPDVIPPEDAFKYPIVIPAGLTVTYKGIERWILEGWNSAERLVPGWNQRRWDNDYDPPVDVLGPPPMDGDYDFIKFLDVLNEEALDNIRHLAKVAVADPLNDSYFQRRLATKEEIAASILRDDLREAEYEKKKAAEEQEMYINDLMPVQKFLFHPHPSEGGGKLIFRTVDTTKKRWV